jgi:hypothetical protein
MRFELVRVAGEMRDETEDVLTRQTTVTLQRLYHVDL